MYLTSKNMDETITITLNKTNTTQNKIVLLKREIRLNPNFVMSNENQDPSF